MKLADRITAILLVVLSGLWIYWARQLPYPKFAQISNMGPGDFPTIVAVMLAIFAIWLFIETLRPSAVQAETDADAKAEGADNPRAGRDILTGFGLFTVMLVITPFIGFVLAAVLFVCGFLLLIGRYRFYLAIPVALLMPALLWFIFDYLLTVPLPKGPWGF